MPTFPPLQEPNDAPTLLTIAFAPMSLEIPYNIEDLELINIVISRLLEGVLALNIEDWSNELITFDGAGYIAMGDDFLAWLTDDGKYIFAGDLY